MVQPLNRRLLTEARAAFASNADPVAAGTADSGTSNEVARIDHVHPSVGLFSIWGTGYDGDLNFDGTTTVTVPDPWAGGLTSFVPASSVYTITQPIAGKIITVGNGVTLALTQSGAIFASEELRCPTGSAIISADGNPGVADAAGAARAAGLRAACGAGGAGQTGAGSAATGVTTGTDQWNSGVGGNGGLGSGGAGGSGSAGAVFSNKTARHWMLRDPVCLLNGVCHSAGDDSGRFLPLAGGVGGGGGGGDGVAKGGGGGSSAGTVHANAKKITGNFTFRAIGGNGGNGAGTNCGGGGGGAGGYVFINTADLSGYTGPNVGLNGTSKGSSLTHCAGGTGGAKTGTGVAGSNGAAGWCFLTIWK